LADHRQHIAATLSKAAPGTSAAANEAAGEKPIGDGSLNITPQPIISGGA
jgi:hypothetical protein